LKKLPSRLSLWLHKPYSEKTAETIDKEISKMVEKAYQRAKSLLLKNKSKLETLAILLLEKEVIFSEDLEIIFGKRPYDDEKTIEPVKTEKKLAKKTKKSLPKTNDQPDKKIVEKESKPQVPEKEQTGTLF
jgi:cell division protease FtsH